MYPTAEKVATIVADCIQSGDPPVRMRTAQWAEALCQLKTELDPTGKTMQAKVIDMFF